MPLEAEAVRKELYDLLQTVDWETTTEKQIKATLREKLGDEVADHTGLFKVDVQ